MTLALQQRDELYDLLDDLQDEQLDDAGCRRLTALLTASDEALGIYVAEMNLHAALAWDWANDACGLSSGQRTDGRGLGTSVQGLGTSVPSEMASGRWPVAGEYPPVGAAVELPDQPGIHHSTFSIQHSAPLVPFIVVDNTLPSPFSPLPSFLFSYTVAAIIFGIAGLCGWLYKVEHYTEFARSFGTSSAAVEQAPPAVEKAVPVARITGMVKCRWERKGLGIGDWGLDEGSGAANPPSKIHHPKSLVRLGDTIALASGLLQLTYQSGANVILQGPCTYEVDSATGGFLSVGKLTARVESRGERREERGEKQVAGKSNIQHPTSNISNPQSLIPNPSLSTTHYPLFTIKTPTAVVTDLGTEFGVEVSKAGLTTSHVFRGSVRLQVASVDGKAEGVAQVLHENQSARVELPDGEHGASCVVVLVPTFAPSTFVREIPRETIKTLDLVDVVAGGDGFSGRRNRGIDPLSGQITHALPVTPGDPEDWPTGDGKYHAVKEMPFVDGVFVPGGSAGPVQIDSTGRTFAGFPVTSNRTVNHVWAGGEIDAPDVNFRISVLGGVDYASAGHGLLFLHASKAVTFDLDAIRRANPGSRVLRFRAVAGITEQTCATGYPLLADVWVLVDGQLRWRRRQINGYSGAHSLAVSIGDNERFLTLASTDGENGIGMDCILFGDPRLEMLSNDDALPYGTSAARQKTFPNDNGRKEVYLESKR